jgi:hypothetical protein
MHLSTLMTSCGTENQVLLHAHSFVDTRQDSGLSRFLCRSEYVMRIRITTKARVIFSMQTLTGTALPLRFMTPFTCWGAAQQEPFA